MKNPKLETYRGRIKNLPIKKRYIIKFKKIDNNSIGFNLPEDIIKTYSINEGDVAIFESIDKNSFMIKFVRNNMYSVVGRCSGN